MTSRGLARLLLAYFAILVVTCVVVRRAVSLREVDGETITTAWKKGESISRIVNGKMAEIVNAGVRSVDEKIVAEGPLVTRPEVVFAFSLVSARDGVKATLAGKTVYVTPDDILAHNGYDRWFWIPSLTLGLGADVQLIEALLAERLGVSVPELLARASFRRIRTSRWNTALQPFAATTPDSLTPDMLRRAAVDAARFLARGVSSEGRFRYTVEATTNRSLSGYDWPRHAGAAYVLAQAADVSHDPVLRDAALRTTGYLRDHATLDCGEHRCVGQGELVDVGSSALALIAMNEIARTGIDPSYRAQVEQLASFLRSQQRPDGEFMHHYDRRAKKPVDTQSIYYSGEVTLALARAFALTGDTADRDAASRGLAHIVGPAWSFFGDRYYFGEEHWTCQALADLWDVAPDAKALSFCERWQIYDRKMMFGPNDTPYDADGSYGVGPIPTPRLTPVASRCEAGIATLEAMKRANADPDEQVALAAQLRRSLALLLRQQFRPGLTHLFADPTAVYGAFPGSAGDWQLRIDFAQHAGSALLRAAAMPALLHP